MAFSVALKMCATACCSCVCASVCASGERLRGYNNICNCNCITTSTQWWILFSLHVHSDHHFFFSVIFRSFGEVFLRSSMALCLSVSHLTRSCFTCFYAIHAFHLIMFVAIFAAEKKARDRKRIPLQWNIILHVNFWFKRNILFAVAVSRE